MSSIAPLLAFLGIALFGAITVSGTFFSETWNVVESRLAQAGRTVDTNGTRIELISASHSTDVVQIVLRNVGREPIRASATWDVWARYHDASGNYYPALFTSATKASTSADEWALAGIFLDAEAGLAEAYQPGIWDPGEEARFWLNPQADPADPESNLAMLALPNGITARVGFSWEALTAGPTRVGRGGALAGDTTYLYALAGDNTPEFWRYDPANDAWAQLGDTPSTVRQGGTMTYAEEGGVGYLYAFPGKATTSFWRYNIADDTWTAMTVAPEKVDDGGSLTWDGVDRLYATRGGNHPAFWSYHLPTDTWSLLPDAPGNINQGGDAEYVDGGVFVLKGNTTAEAWRFDIATGVWVVISSPPATVSEDGGFAADGEDLYALPGNNSTAFWKYSVARDTWTLLPDVPAVVRWGSDLAEMNGVLYSFRGDNASDFWKYPLPIYQP
jgi:hypothetical protein